MKKFYLLLILFTIAFSSNLFAQAFFEGFEDVAALPAKGWDFVHNNSNPYDRWIQGQTAANFVAQSGPYDSYIGSYYKELNDSSIFSSWMILPVRLLNNGDKITFYTRNAFSYNDKLEVRLSINGNSTSISRDFNTLLLSINPSQVDGGYPADWAQYTAIISGLAAPVSGRIALGNIITNYIHRIYSHKVGIDNLVYQTQCSYSGRLYVDSSRTVSGIGDTWQNAFSTLQEALHAADSCSNVNEIWVKKGTYFPTNDKQRKKSFNISRPGLKLYGGFNGTEASLAERNSIINPTYLSGNITRDTIQNTGHWETNAPVGEIPEPVKDSNSYHVITIAYLNGLGDSVVVDGFTIMQGHATRPADYGLLADSSYGGGIYVKTDYSIKVSIRNCTFQQNLAIEGGGIANEGNSSLNVINCAFLHNNSENSAGIHNSSFLNITNSLFTGNLGNSVKNKYDCLINSCTFFDNSGNGVSNSKDCSITNSILWNNDGGQIDTAGKPSTVNYSIVEGGYPGTGNLNKDPLFINTRNLDGDDNLMRTSDDGLKLQPGSSAINSGNNDFIPAGITTDITMANRIAENTVDMGAYENTPVTFSPVIVFVDSSSSASGDGATWASSFKTLTEAITLANNRNDVNEIWVAKGTYYPTADNSRDSSFRILRSGFKIYGGFTGTDTLLAQRKPWLNQTILSGDIGTKGNNADNSYHVITIIASPSSPIDSLTRIDGFTIKDGNANVFGSFIYNRNYIVQNRGAGIHIFGEGEGSGNYCKPSIIGCVFTNNNSTGDGGAIYNNGYLGNCSPLLVNCVFSINSAGNGGGIYNYGGYGISSPSIINCTFNANNAGNGGAVYNNGTGSGSSNPAITNSILYGNTASSGADIFNSGSGAVPVINYSFTQTAVSGNGNITAAASPFYNAADADGQDNILGTSDDGLRLKTGSPALNIGINDSLLLGDTLDIRGAQRIQQSIVDMGAYEGAVSGITLTLTAAAINCNSGTTVIKASSTSGTSPYQYSLNGGAYSTTKQFTVTAGTYIIGVKDATGDTTSKSIVITQPTPITVSLTKTDVSCYGQSNGSVTVTAGGGTPPYTYRISTTTNYQSSNIFTALTARSYTMYAKDANGCIKSTSISITQPALLKLTAGTKTDASCNGADGTTNVGISGGKAPYQFNIDGGVYQSAGSFTGLTAGAHTVTAKDANSCTASLSITINQAAAVTATLTAKLILCNGGKATITATGAGGKSPYLYRFIDNATGATLVDYQSTRTLSVTAGSYKAMVKDSKGCEGTSSIITVTQPDPLQASVQKTDVSCTGQSDGSATVTGTGGTAPYQYKIGSGAYQSSNTFTGLAKGTYKAYVKDANGCSISLSFTIAKTTNCSMVMARPAENKATSLPEFRIQVFPNPSAAEFSLLINSNKSEIAEIRVVDIYGREVYKVKGEANKAYHFGDQFVPGSYIVHVIQGNNTSTLNLVKVK